MVLSSKQFRRMVVDAYVYHKHCWSFNDISPMIAAGRRLPWSSLWP
jgi:hypothetical protein